MPRTKTGVTRRHRHKKVLKANKGFRGANSRLYKRANEALPVSAPIKTGLSPTRSKEAKHWDRSPRNTKSALEPLCSSTAYEMLALYKSDRAF